MTNLPVGKDLQYSGRSSKVSGGRFQASGFGYQTWASPL